MSNIDPSLPALTTGEEVGKIPVAVLRQQLATAKQELESLAASINALNQNVAANG